MKNYINVRIQTYNHYKEKNDIKHNTGENNKQSIVNNGKIDTFYNYQEQEPLKTLKIWREEHNQNYKKRRKQNLKNNQSSLINGVITFSQVISKDLGTKYTKEEWEQANIKTVEEIAQHLGTEISYITFHYQEKTPHCHYHLKNFDNQGYSIFYKYHKKEELSKLQDIAFKHLEPLGMERGQKKEITNRTHKKTQDYYIKQYRAEVKKLKSIRKEVESLKIETDKKKKIYKQITEAQSKLRELQKSTDIERIKEERVQAINYANELEQYIEKLTEEPKEEKITEQVKRKSLKQLKPFTGVIKWIKLINL